MKMGLGIQFFSQFHLGDICRKKKRFYYFLNKSVGINEKWEFEVELAFHEGN